MLNGFLVEGMVVFGFSHLVVDFLSFIEEYQLFGAVIFHIVELSGVGVATVPTTIIGLPY